MKQSIHNASIHAKIGLVKFFYEQKYKRIRLAVYIFAFLLLQTNNTHATVYDVGPGQVHTELGTVPWTTLTAGDIVQIHWRSTPYAAKIFLRAQGTAENPVIIRGIPNASGDLPIITAENAITNPQFIDYFDPVYTEDLAMFLIFRGPDDPWATYKPKHIIFEYLELIGTRPEHTFTDQFGNTRNYSGFGTAICGIVCENLTIRHCKIHDNSQGIFTNTNGTTENEISRNLLIEYNEIWGNGNVGDDRHHNIYAQAAGTIIQYNKIGKLIPGCLGSSLKDRSSGTVIRYNTIESSARAIDMVESEDGYQILMQESNYHNAYVYGNIITNDVTSDPFSASMIHFGGFSPISTKRGTLFFYHNTVYIVGDETDYWHVKLFDVYDDDNASTTEGSIAMYNNILRKDGTTHFKFMRYGGTLTYFPNNWFQDGYEDLHVGATAAIVYNTPPIIGTNPGFTNEAGYDFTLADNSPCIDQAISLTGIIPAEYLPTMQYDEPANGIPRTMGGSAFDLGALENQDILPDPNTPPTISNIDDQTINQDESLTDLPFTIADNETLANDLIISAVSSNQALVQNSAITFGGSGENRILSITPVAGQFGTTEITVTVSDGVLSTSTTFTLTVLELAVDPNTPPTISNIDDQTINQDESLTDLPFTIADNETLANDLIISAVSSNQALVQNSAITFGGLGENRTLSITPVAGQFGTTEITITVSDGELTTSTTFTLTVLEPTADPNTPPTISNIEDQTINQDESLTDLPFTISDAETLANDLIVSAVSSNLALVLNSAITFGDSGENRTLSITPVAGQFGTTEITITVSDGVLTTSTTFTLTVLELAPDPNTPPSISNIDDQTINQDESLTDLPFTISDAETLASDLIVSAVSSQALVINTGITFGGSGANRMINITPVAGLYGSTDITVAVSDGDKTASVTFTLTVKQIILDPNLPPTISNIDNQVINQDETLMGLPFTITDDKTSADDLAITVVSSNLTLVANSGISLAGSGENRTLSIIPVTGQFGSTIITVTVSDGQYETSENFRLTVKPPIQGRDEFAFNLINYPNPFKENTTIEYTLKETTHINIKIYDMKGSFLKQLVNENQAKGTHYIPWNRSTDGGERIQDDLYIYMLTMNKNEVHMGRMMISH